LERLCCEGKELGRQDKTSMSVFLLKELAKRKTHKGNKDQFEVEIWQEFSND